ncbi:hypothetical protein O3P69_017573 [Scylla paramamosain]|uniref:Uncharacterized protein n=1 Tax=Scylla paramamosain TaxID=85552 RepID=A0AAW0TZD4_SCYPA
MEDEESPEECKVCITNYDKAKRRPRTLPCGHSFCSLCLGGMIKEEKLTCPSCRNTHNAASPDAFPISYDMEAIIRKLKILQYKAEFSNSPDGPAAVKEKVESVKRVLARLQETLTQLGRYESQLQDWVGDHDDLLTRLTNLVVKNQSAVRLLKDERGILEYQRSKGEEAVRQLEAMQESLTAAASPQEAVCAIDESEARSSEAEDWMEHCHTIFPDQITVHTSLTVRRMTSRALEEAKKAEEGGSTSGDLHSTPESPTVLTIMEKVDLIAPVLSVETLRRLGDPVKTLLEEGRVGAAQHQREGGEEGATHSSRRARLSLREGLVHLHALEDQTESTPAPTHLIPHEALVHLLDYTSSLVFLTLAWAGAEGGTVYIRLTPDTELARQFLLLCSGETGPSYRHSRLLGVWNKGTEFEMVGGGDYDRNDGHGGAPIVENLRPRREYQRPALAGTVRAMHGPVSSKSAQFSISTQDCASREWHWAFGRVEKGLDVVRAAANHTAIKEVTVVDCGVVVPL